MGCAWSMQCRRVCVHSAGNLFSDALLYAHSTLPCGPTVAVQVSRALHFMADIFGKADTHPQVRLMCKVRCIQI